jgi:hypothetical protein
MDFLGLLGFFIFSVVLQRSILPKFGVLTCLKTTVCRVPGEKKRDFSEEGQIANKAEKPV